MAPFIFALLMMIIYSSFPGVCTDDALLEASRASKHVKFESSPSGVLPGVSPFSIRCYTASKSEAHESVISIRLKKWNRTKANFDNLAFIELFEPNKVKASETIPAKTEGKISAVAESYLNIEWESPTEDHTGEYACETFLIGNYGNPINITKRINPGMGFLNHTMAASLIEEIEELKREGQKCRENVAALLKEKRECVTSNGPEITSTTPGGMGKSITFCTADGFCITQQYSRSTSSSGDDVYDSASSLCYKLNSDLQTWADARKKCESKGGRLGEIHDAGTQEVITSGTIEFPLAWLGARDEGRGEGWRWTSGANMSSSLARWSRGLRGNDLGEEACLYIGYSDWLPRKCSSLYRYICERADNTDCDKW